MPRGFLQLRVLLAMLIGGGALYGIVAPTTHLSYDRNMKMLATMTSSSVNSLLAQQAPEPVFVVTHIATPRVVKAAYMTSCVASGKKLRAPMVAL
ncbi:MAG: hypothetical protein AAB869_03955, partial [Patescibacteria group bacterium]